MAALIDAQPYCIVYQRERYSRQQQRYHQHHQHQFAQVAVHLVHQVFLIGHLRHLLKLLYLLGYYLQRVTVGLTRLQVYLCRGHKGVHAEKFRRVGAQCLCLLLERTVTVYILQMRHPRLELQLAAYHRSLVVGYIILEHHRHGKVLLNIV